MSDRGRMDVLLGAQWGDEGKGKVVDVVAPSYGVVTRFQGGPNAGHTLWIEGKKFVLHTIPSGVFHERTVNVVGNGVVIDPITFMQEIDELAAIGLDIRERLLIGRRAHLILPTHRLLDAASEKEKGQDRIGSTLKGIGPTYMDKTGRNGLRVGDLERSDLRTRYTALKNKHKRLLAMYGPLELQQEQEDAWFDAVDRMRELKLIDSEHFLNDALAKGERILAEGAQGTLLDIDFGTYPFVTSSHTTSAGACAGTGVAPGRIGKVIGIFKAYCTRVGSGPFPTELTDEVGQRIREAGKEFGSTTGRPRRCGWLDLPALRYAVMINGITELCMMKADVLAGSDTLKVCQHYRTRNGRMDLLPFDMADDHEAELTEMPGWGPIHGAELPEALDLYIRTIEKAVGVPITLVSTGPGREETIMRSRSIEPVR